MYNEEVKRKFLEWYQKDHVVDARFEKWFNDIELFERKFGMDFSELSEEEMSNCISSMSLVSSASVQSMLSFLWHYTKWCQDFGAFPQRAHNTGRVKATSVNMAGGFFDAYLKNEAEFLRAMRLVHEFDNGYPDIPYLIFAWLGLSKEYAISVKESDVDLNDKVIYGSDGLICAMGFSDEIRDALQDFKDCKVATRGTGRGPRTVYKDMSVDMFIKRFEKRGSDKFGIPYTCEQIEAQFRQARAIAGENALTRKLSFKKARKSGVFNRVYRVECSGIDVFDIKNKPVVLRVVKGFMTYRDFLQDYKAFKEAFNL